MVKGDILRVKRSGVRLGDVCSSGHFVNLPCPEVRGLFQDFLDSDHEMGADTELERRYVRNGAPSVESWFHALLGPVTAHAHLVSALAVSSQKQPGMPPELIIPGFSAWIPYAPPGFFLAKKIARCLPDPLPVQGVLLLQNHGVILWGSSGQEVTRRLDAMDAHFRQFLLSRARVSKDLFFPGEEDLLQAVPVAFPSASGGLCVRLEGKLWDETGRPEYLQAPLTPDHALHFGHGLAMTRGAPRVFGHLSLENGKLFFHAVNRQVLDSAVELVSSQLAAMHVTGGNLRCLDSVEVDNLLAWGAGKYSGVLK